MKLPERRNTITIHLNELQLRQLQEQTRQLKHDPESWDDLESVAKAVLTVHVKRAVETTGRPKGKSPSK
jgi:hypothetical protein